MLMESFKKNIAKIYDDMLLEMAYPDSFSFLEFESISSYAKKLQYANTHLQKISSGSSRVIFKIDDEKVLKVAKNIKGLAQNDVESNYMIHQWYGDIVAKVFKIGDTVKDTGPFYLEMELAKKISPKRFETILGFKMNDLDTYLKRMAFLEGRIRYNVAITDEMVEFFNNDPFVIELWGLINDFDMVYPGDFTKTTTYGEVIRGGVPTVVLIDIGLSRSVYLNYYAK